MHQNVLLSVIVSASLTFGVPGETRRVSAETTEDVTRRSEAPTSPIEIAHAATAGPEVPAPCGWCANESVAICWATFGEQECHRFTDGNEEDPGDDDRGEDIHTILAGTSNVGGEGYCDEETHPECKPQLAWAEIREAIGSGDAVRLRHLLREEPNVTVVLNLKSSSVEFRGACDEDRPTRVIGQFPVSAGSIALWFGKPPGSGLAAVLSLIRTS